jgi:hypothetical protein
MATPLESPSRPSDAEPLRLAELVFVLSIASDLGMGNRSNTAYGHAGGAAAGGPRASMRRRSAMSLRSAVALRRLHRGG